MDSVELSIYRFLYLCALILALTPVFFGARWFWRQRFSPLRRRLRGAIVFAPLISLCAFPLFHLNFGWRVCYETFEWVTDEYYIKMALHSESIKSNSEQPGLKIGNDGWRNISQYINPCGVTILRMR